MHIPWAAARPQVVCQQQIQYTVSSEHSSCQSGYMVGLLSGTGSRELWPGFTKVQTKFNLSQVDG